MSLLQFPTEVLLLILRLLGAAFFRDDIRRLMVSKLWYELARPILLEDLVFSEQSLQKFLNLDMSSLVHQHTRTVNFALDGVQDDRGVATASRHKQQYILAQWVANVGEDLISLASILQDCKNLRSVELKPGPKWLVTWVMSRTWFLPNALISLLNVGHLTCLEFDTISTGIGGPSRGTGGPSYRETFHLCDNINALLPTLRRLRCRMRKICPRVLIPPGDDTLSNLEEVIINLNLNDPNRRTPLQHSHRCGIFESGSPRRWITDMEAGAKELVKRMTTPRVVRILSCPRSGDEMESFDAIARRRMKLATGAAWDADGKEVFGADDE
ncbi:hypothetical protein CEP53_002204 [Fusarium sp. AF-6]|nr:hypothetical protein CEP53_002204 [Fusarium sp. AF-6]